MGDRTVDPPAAAFQNMKNAADHPPVINPGVAAHVGRQEWLDLRQLRIVSKVSRQ
jgi:hypothetical protein